MALLGSLLASLLGRSATSQQPGRQAPPTPRVGVDSFALRFTGMPEGRHVFSLQPAASGYLYREDVAMGDQFRRSITLHLSPTLAVTSHESEGTIFGQPTQVQVRYRDGRARGTATVVGPQGSRKFSVDTLLPSDAFDGQALVPVILATPWRVGETRALRIFDLDEQNVTTQRLHVVAREQLTVPAGRFAALRAELSTTQLPVTIWVTEAQPHRLLKVGSSNGETVLLP
jgi:hypothetical protein